jgi:hypothetical protein
MANFKFRQSDWKGHVFFFLVNFVAYRIFLDNFEFISALLLSLTVVVIMLILFWRNFDSVAEFKDSYLLVKKGWFKKAEHISYSDFQKITYSNVTRFLKLILYTNNQKIELPPPVRLAQAEELFAWLRTKNPLIKLEIIKPESVLEFS